MDTPPFSFLSAILGHDDRRNREDGNAAFQSGDYPLALLLYSEALRYAEVDPDTLRGEEFASIAANRSAALFQLNRFELCLQVGIDRACL